MIKDMHMRTIHQIRFVKPRDYIKNIKALVLPARKLFQEFLSEVFGPCTVVLAPLITTTFVSM